MAYIQSLGTGGVNKIRLYLYGRAYSSSSAFNTGYAQGSVSGSGTYQIQNVFVSKVTCISGSMELTYDNEQNTSVTTTLTQGQTVLINNDSGITLAWSDSESYSAYTSSSASGYVTSDITVDVFF